MEKHNRQRLRNIQRPRWMVNGFGILHLLGRSASQATRNYRVQLNLSSIEFMRTYADAHGCSRIVDAPCSSVRCSPLNSLLQRVAQEYVVRVAVDLFPIIDRRPEQAK